MNLTWRLKVGSFLFLPLVVWYLSFGAYASAHWAPQIPQHNLHHALNLVWCGKSTRVCRGSIQAWTITGCETGYTYSVWASNGQYLGIFQMGNIERRRYGHGNNVWAQSRAAHRYWLQSGWSPWECAWRMGIFG